MMFVIHWKPKDIVCMLGAWLIICFSPQVKNKPCLPWVYSWIQHRCEQQASCRFYLPCMAIEIHITICIMFTRMKQQKQIRTHSPNTYRILCRSYLLKVDFFPYDKRKEKCITIFYLSEVKPDMYMEEMLLKILVTVTLSERFLND